MKENNDIENDPRDRNKAASNLKFKTVAKGQQLKQIDDKPGLNDNTAEVNHPCPQNQTFDKNAGKCIFTSDKEKVKPNHPTDNDVHLVSDQKQDLLMNQQRNVLNRMAFQPGVKPDPAVDAHRKPFHNFQAKSKNKATSL